MNWEEYKVWFMRSYGEQRYYGNGCCGPMFIACVLALFILMGCRTAKTAESTDKQDSVRIEYREKIVKVPVEVIVEVPAEQKERETKDSTSYLETSFAKSTASLIWRGAEPFLYHSLENKAQSIVKSDSVPVVEKEKIVYRTIRETVTKTVYKNFEPKWWQSALMWAGGIAATLICFFIVFNFIRFFR